MDSNLKEFYSRKLDSFMALSRQARQIKEEALAECVNHFEGRDYKVRQSCPSPLVRGTRVRVIQVAAVFVPKDEITVLVAPYKNDHNLSGRTATISINDLMEVKNDEK